MIEASALIAAGVAGACIAVVYLGLLWLAVGHYVRRRRLDSASLLYLLLRNALLAACLSGIFLVGSWMTLLAAMAGFLVARLLVCAAVTRLWDFSSALSSGEMK